MANSKKACKHCKDYFRVDEMIISRIGAFCSKYHESEWLQLQFHKQQEKDKKKISKKSLHQAKKSKGKQFSELVVQFNEVRRYEEFLWFAKRNCTPRCISCSCVIDRYNATNGHFITQAVSRSLAINPVNSYLQCIECNSGLSGNINGISGTHGYKAGLAKRFGTTKENEIIDFCERNKHGESLNANEVSRLLARLKAKAQILKEEIDTIAQ